MKILVIISVLSSIVFSGELQFTPLDLAKTDQEISSIRVSKSAKIGEKRYRLEYQKLIYTSQKLKESKFPFGTLVDKDLNPMTFADGSFQISTSVDSNSIVKAGKENYLITHLESNPGVLYATHLDVKDSHLIALETEPMDFSSVAGTLINCAGSATPWNSHLGGEEDYRLNSRYADMQSPFYIACEQKNRVFSGNRDDTKKDSFCGYVSAMQDYLNDESIDKAKGYNGKLFTPYNYGYIIEAGLDENGKSEVAKHYVTGKYTPELAIVMPDQKTFYMSDDGNGKGLYKFVSDNKIESFVKNWSGTLYMAKAKQISKTDGGEFELSWLELGHSSDDKIKSMIDKGIQISDIFELKNVKEKRCEEGFTKIFEDSASYCLRLKDAKESHVFSSNQELLNAAAFLESRKYGAYLGGTTEFVKEEGITYDKEKNVMYVAMSSIKGAMLDNYENSESANDIRLDKNICGGVYEVALDDAFSATKMKGLVNGKELHPDDKDAELNRCRSDLVSNPDNILYIGNNTLLIGEDTQYHLNNMLWAYNTDSKALTRIVTLPIGGEVTGLESTQIKDRKILFVNVQHPFEDIPQNAQGHDVKADLIHNAGALQKDGFVGYIEFTEVKK